MLGDSDAVSIAHSLRKTELCDKNCAAVQLILLKTFDRALCNCLKMRALQTLAGLEGV
jgi:hypothetical protein